MIINTDKGQIDTAKPMKCVRCRRMFFGGNKPGQTTIAHGKAKFVCWQCEPQVEEKKPC